MQIYFGTSTPIRLGCPADSDFWYSQSNHRQQPSHQYPMYALWLLTAANSRRFLSMTLSIELLASYKLQLLALDKHLFSSLKLKSLERVTGQRCGFMQLGVKMMWPTPCEAEAWTEFSYLDWLYWPRNSLALLFCAFKTLQPRSGIVQSSENVSITK